MKILINNYNWTLEKECNGYGLVVSNGCGSKLLIDKEDIYVTADNEYYFL